MKSHHIFPVHTTVEPEPKTHYRNIDSEAFEYPFFNDGVNRQTSDSRRYQLQEIVMSDKVKLLAIKGFIFHTSHCGSTLLSRMLNESPNVRVVSETEAINGLLLAHIFHGLPRTKLLKQLKSIMEAYRYPMKNEKYLIFKLTSWNVFLADLFHEIYPNTNWAYIDRKTEDVVDSLQQSNGGMEKWWYQPTDILRRYFIGPNTNCTTKETYLTLLIEQHRKQAIRFSNNRLLSISYPSFINEFEKVILPHFDLNFSERELEDAIKIKLFNAKSPMKIIFQKDVTKLP